MCDIGIVYDNIFGMLEYAEGLVDFANRKVFYCDVTSRKMSVSLYVDGYVGRGARYVADMDSLNLCIAFFVVGKVFPLIDNVGGQCYNAFQGCSGMYVLHQDVLDKTSTAMIGLDIKETGYNSVYFTVVHPHIAHTARDFRPDTQQGMSVGYYTITDNNILRGTIETPSIGVAPAFNDNSIVSLIEVAVLHQNVPCHVDVYSVVVVTMRTDVQSTHDTILAHIYMYGPEGALTNGEVLQNNILAAVQLNGTWCYIDKTGNEVTPIKYDGAVSFVNGKARVKLNGKWVYIDKQGNFTP